jgi:hypothetical protein
MSEILREALAAQSETFNSRVKHALRANPSLEPDVLAALLKEGLAPIIDAIDAKAPAYRAQAVFQGFDLALEVSALGLGRNGAAPSMIRLWKSLAGQAESMAADFKRELASVSNALLFLRGQEGARAEEWLERLERLPPLGSHLREALLVLAWLCGVAPWRKRALLAARSLPADLCEACFGEDGLHKSLERLEADPWWDPKRGKGPRLMKWIGDFAGNDGPFLEPPKVRVVGDRLVVEGGAHLLELHADRFGVMLIPHSVPTGKGGASGTLAGFTWKQESLHTSNGSIKMDFPEEGRGAVGLNGVIAVSSPFSFRIAVVAP